MKTAKSAQGEPGARAQRDAGQRAQPGAPPARGRHEAVIAVLLVACVLLVAFWEIMSNRSRSPFEPFALSAESLAGFAPSVPGWEIEGMPVNPDPVEPNILAFLMRQRTTAGSAAPVFVRLVHGYNMVDCMRIKGEAVELILDSRRGVAPVAGSAPLSTALQQEIGAGDQARRVQLWRLTSSTGRVGIWATSMLRAADFAETDDDTRSMAFPRVDVPDNPGWWPRGLSWRSMRHPVKNLRLFLRAKWNSSRADPLTFLGLRQPAWASDELLTLVATSLEPTVSPECQSAVAETVLDAQQVLLAALQDWHRTSGEGNATPASGK